MKLHCLFPALLVISNLACGYASFAQHPSAQPVKYIDSLAGATGGSAGYVDQETYKEVENILPKNTGKQVGLLPALNEASVVAMAKNYLQTILPKLDAATKTKLDQLLADPATNAAGTGIILLGAGMPKAPGSYLVIKDVIAHPKSEWAVNDMGILFRDKNQVDKAVQCFVYAEKLNQQSPVIKSNLAWASAYYGDFTTARKYFNEVIAVKPDFNSALEGLAFMAYRQGNENALFSSLKKQVFTMAMGGGGPSTTMTNICGGIFKNEESRNYENEDPFNNHNYDNNADVDGMNQDPPPGADDDPVNYPSLKPIFVNSPAEALKLAGGTILYNYQQKIMELLKKNDDLLSRAEGEMPLYKKPSYLDEQGLLVTPYNYEKYIMLFTQVTQLFHWREDRINKEYSKKTGPFIKDVLQHDLDLSTAYGKALGDCADDDCRKRVKCEWLPKFNSTAAGDLNAAAKMWSTYFAKHVDNFNWYIQATSPLFQRVHDQQWNKRLNREREVDVRNGVLSMYKEWTDLFPQTVNFFISPLLSEALDENITLECKVEAGTMGGADPYSQKIKKLATYDEACRKEEWSVNLGGFSYVDNCDHMKIEIGSPVVKLLFEQQYHKPNSGKQDYFLTGLEVSLSKGIEYEQKSGPVTSSVGGELGANLTFFSKFNSSFHQVQKGIDVEIEASAKAELKAEDAGDHGLENSKGVSAHFTVSALCGPDGSVGPYQVGEVSFEKQE